MAQLPPSGEWLIQYQELANEVVLFHRDTEEEIVRFNPSGPNTIGPALEVIWKTDKLTEEQKCFACFWTGYFYATTYGETNADV